MTSYDHDDEAWFRATEPWLGPHAARVFDAVASTGRAEDLGAWDVVAAPGQALREALQPGDLLVRRALGEGRLAHVATLVSGNLQAPEAHRRAGLPVGDRTSGLYADVVESGPPPHARPLRIARLVVRSDGVLARDTLILRPHASPVAPIPEAADPSDAPAWVLGRVRMYLDSKPYLHAPKDRKLREFFDTSPTRTAAFGEWTQMVQERTSRNADPPTNIIDIAIAAFFRRDQIEAIETLVRRGGTTIVSPLCGHPGALFLTTADFNARLSSWSTKLDALLRTEPEVFWSWVQGALSSSASRVLQRIASWKSSKAEPCAAGELHAQIHAAAIESRAQLELVTLVWGSSNRYPLWSSELRRKVGIESGFRSRSNQTGKYEEKSGKKLASQRKTMFARSAPTLSRHHWGTDFDLFEVSTAGTAHLETRYNEPFKAKGSYWEEWSFLTDFGHLFGFVQPYVGSSNAGEKDGKNSPPGSIVGIRDRAIVPMWRRVEDGQLVEPPRDDARGYLEERWHWSYAPVAQAITRILGRDDDTREFHRRAVAYWTTRGIDKYRYPEKYGLDYVFNVAVLDAFRWV